MTDSNDTKTKEQLLAEIEALQDQLAAKSAGADENASARSAEPTFSRPMTRREALTNWIAPVVLSVPIVAAMRSETAHAQAPGPQPTLGPEPTERPPQPPQQARSVPGLGTAGAVALGGALAAAGAKALKNRKNTSDDESEGGS